MLELSQKEQRLSYIPEHGEDSDTEDSTNFYYLFVSLYLVVLAFFILLAAISSVEEERTDEALGSIRNTFSNIKHDLDIPTIEVISPAGGEIALKNYFSTIKLLAQEQLALTKANIIEQGNTLRVTLPASSLFSEGTATILPEQEPFILLLADQLTTSSETQTKLIVEALFDSSQVNETPTAQTDITIARAGALARELASVGVSADQIHVGITQRGAYTLTLTFELVSQQTSEVTFEPEDRASDDTE